MMKVVDRGMKRVPSRKKNNNSLMAANTGIEHQTDNFSASLLLFASGRGEQLHRQALIRFTRDL